MSLPVVAIVGRPNVGKSTLFNRLAGNRISIIEDQPGVTRDRIYSQSEWNGQKFHLIDTGGLQLHSKAEFSNEIQHQAELAIDEADVILFIVDGRAGLTSTDIEVGELLRKSRKDVIVVVNKVDNPGNEAVLFDFYQLGFQHVFGVSSVHGKGTGDMLDQVILLLPSSREEDVDEDTIRVSIIGRPNVGKSSLLNAILGEERVLVSGVSGTTRDAVDTPFEYEDQKYVLVDTAGIRKRGKVYESVEKYSVLRALKSIERSDVCLLVLDGEQGIIEQDKKIAGYAHQAGRGILIVVNKWDAVEKDDKTMHQFVQKIRSHFQFIHYAPIVFTSAKTKRRVNSILPKVLDVAEQHSLRISTSVLNNVIQEAILMVAPPQDKGVRFKIHYITQVSVKPPTFVLFVNNEELSHFSYLRYLENKLRESFSFVGTPIHIVLRSKK